MQTLISFVKDQQRYHHQRYAVNQRGQNFESVISVSFFRVMRSFANPYGDYSQPKSGNIGQHVSCVGQQSQTVCVDAAKSFGEHVNGCKSQDDAQTTTIISGRAMTMAMTVIMVVTMAMSVV